MNYDFQLPNHTVVVLCGPTGCGKSTMAKAMADSVSAQGFSTVVLSSDAFRQQLLSREEHRHHPDMLAVSKQAFDLLMASLRSHTAYPVNTSVVIVDTTGFDETFRKSVCDVARDNGYQTALMTFEYKDQADYMRCLDYGASGVTPAAIRGSLSRFRKKVLLNLKRRDYSKTFRITKHLGDGIVTVEIDAKPNESTTLFLKDGPVAVIGDSHECTAELVKLMGTVSAAYAGVRFVLAGDYLDKGGDTQQMLDLLAGLPNAAIVKGNHEHYVVQRLRGEVDGFEGAADHYFTSLGFLRENPEYAEKLIGLYERSHSFVNIVSECGRRSIVTHAPCSTKYLGKTSNEAMRHQRNYRFDRELDVTQQLAWFRAEANTTHPVHIVGHVSHTSESLEYKNKVFLDTAAVYGYKLSCIVLHGEERSYVSVPCEKRREKRVERLPSNLTQSDRQLRGFSVLDYDLSPEDQRWLRHLDGNGVRFMSGTMPPSPSTADSLESIEAALAYFAERGIATVCIQPKYMGSRAQMYLYREREACFMTSRNGWRVRSTPQLEALLDKWHETYLYVTESSTLIFDGELLPWSALGRGLIEGSFKTYSTVVRDELTQLSGCSWFSEHRVGEDHAVPERLKMLDVYDDTLSSFAGESELEFKPFDVLTMSELSPDKAFSFANTDQYVVVSVADTASALKYYNTLTLEKGMEGVVVKPMEWRPGLTPYMKVRNPEYLTLIYGYDYKSRIDKLIQQRDITAKARLAAQEYALGQEMLTCPEEKLVELRVKMIGNIKQEFGLDPRL